MFRQVVKASVSVCEKEVLHFCGREVDDGGYVDTNMRGDKQQ